MLSADNTAEPTFEKMMFPGWPEVEFEKLPLKRELFPPKSIVFVAALPSDQFCPYCPELLTRSVPPAKVVVLELAISVVVPVPIPRNVTSKSQLLAVEPAIRFHA